MSFPRYPKYKPSGVEWLGEVPEHWTVQPFKWHVQRNDGGVWGQDPTGVDDTVVLRSTEQTVDGHWRIDNPAYRHLSRDEVLAAMLLEGDLLITKSSGSSLHIGKTTLVSAEVAAMRCCYSNFMQRIRTAHSFRPKLAWYVLNSALARKHFDLLSNSTTGLANLNGDLIGQLIVSAPPVPEQIAIAAFLDRETAKIDALIAEQEKLIELLAEKRQAVISHAVTRGLNPAAPMKPSGIEWLGDVPAHWDVLPIRMAARLESGHTPSRNHPEYWEHCTVPWFSLADVWQIREANRDVIIDTSECISELGIAHSAARKLPPGTVMLSRTASVGFSAIMGVEMATTQDFANWVCGPRLTPEYLLRVFRAMKPEFGRLMMGSTHNTIYMPDIQSMRCAVPPITEQAAIVAFIAKESARIDQLSEAASRAATILRERRSALISAAVTGQIDVRNAAPEPAA